MQLLVQCGNRADVVNGFEEGMQRCRALAEQALGMDPRHPVALRFLSGALSALGRQPEALAAARRALDLCPSYATAYSALAFVHDYLGDFDEARTAADAAGADAVEAMERIRASQPGITLETMIERVPFTQPAHRAHLAAGLERAGWRDRP